MAFAIHPPIHLAEDCYRAGEHMYGTCVSVQQLRVLLPGRHERLPTKAVIPSLLITEKLCYRAGIQETVQGT